MVVRKDYLRASKAMQERVMKTPNIEVLFGYTTVEVLGDENGVTGALVRHTGGEEKVIDAFGFFLGIGHHPNTQLFEGQLELDKEGYIKTVPGSSQTSVKGGFRSRRRAGSAVSPGHYGCGIGMYGGARLRTLSAGHSVPAIESVSQQNGW